MSAELTRDFPKKSEGRMYVLFSDLLCSFESRTTNMFESAYFGYTGKGKLIPNVQVSAIF